MSWNLGFLSPESKSEVLDVTAAYGVEKSSDQSLSIPHVEKPPFPTSKPLTNMFSLPGQPFLLILCLRDPPVPPVPQGHHFCAASNPPPPATQNAFLALCSYPNNKWEIPFLRVCMSQFLRSDVSWGPGTRVFLNPW